ncbi:rCG63453 [Rattus norvegicus]|uniref:RCG63453 n=1 Tax=Rattus norvegicus TaxID=10116 RepID=A6HBI0_RAT|nr:rCG63453 [Rattus norvegicus]
MARALATDIKATVNTLNFIGSQICIEIAWLLQLRRNHSQCWAGKRLWLCSST